MNYALSLHLFWETRHEQSETLHDFLHHADHGPESADIDLKFHRDKREKLLVLTFLKVLN